MTFTRTVNVGDTSAMEQALLAEMGANTRRAIERALGRAHEKATILVREAILASPTSQSILSGDLREELGLGTGGKYGGGIDPQQALDSIINAICGTMDLSYHPGSGSSLGSLSLSVLRADFSEALSASGASYLSLSAKGSALIPWLEWLLFRGTELVVRTAELNTARQTRAASRTGRAIMVTRRERASTGYSIPPEHAGHVEANFLTRALDAVLPALADLLGRELEAF